jgi:hypothetical protein
MLFTWERRFAERLRIGGPWWKPDLRWQVSAVVPVFALLALGSLVLGVYKGFSSAPVIVCVVGGLEFSILLLAAAWLIWKMVTTAPKAGAT